MGYLATPAHTSVTAVEEALVGATRGDTVRNFFLL